MLSLSDIVNVKVGIGKGVFEAPGATVIGGKKPSINLEILKLFANGEQGFWYDPDDLTTMFQDAAGTTPVTAVGRAVGLMLDKSEGLVLGLNIATTTSVIGEGIGGAEFKQTTVTSAAVAGRMYKVSYRVENYTGSGDVGFVSVSFGAGSPKPTKGFVEFYAIAQQNLIRMYTRSSNNADFIDIKIQEVFGNHAYQTTSAARPILRRNAVTGANYLEFDGVDDFLEIGSMAAPKPFSTMHGVTITKLVSGSQAILSGAANGYLYTAQRSGQPMLVVASQQLTGNPQILVERGGGDVFFMRSDARGLNIKTNKDSITRLDIISTDPYGENSRKFIGTYSASLAVHAGMRYYGGVLIAKSLTDVEEAALRSHYNKRMGFEYV